MRLDRQGRREEIEVKGKRKKKKRRWERAREKREGEITERNGEEKDRKQRKGIKTE